jgi:hypothetical protein
MGFKYFSNGDTEPPNPDPDNFTVLSRTEYGRYTAALVKYPGCTTFKGIKVLVVKDMPAFPYHLDPHFGADPEIMARYPYTPEGKKESILYAHKLNLEEIA